MTNIVFIQNKGNSNSWSVIDNETGDIKGFVSSYEYAGINRISWVKCIAYQFCYIDAKGKMQIHEVDDLTDAQIFFINEVS